MEQIQEGIMLDLLVELEARVMGKVEKHVTELVRNDTSEILTEIDKVKDDILSINKRLEKKEENIVETKNENKKYRTNIDGQYRLKFYLRDHEMSQKVFAERVGSVQATISTLISGKGLVTEDIARNIANELGTGISDIFTEHTRKRTNKKK